LGNKRSDVVAEIEEWEANARTDREYEIELVKLKEKYYPREKAA